MDIEKIGIVGCGQSGQGIALLSSQAGYQTIISDINEDILRKGFRAMDAQLNRNIARGRLLKRDADTVHSNLTGVTRIEDFSDCDIVLEAITENEDQKKNIIETLDKICSPDTILASNTACFSITDLAMVTKRPDKFIGIHFFNPVTTMTLLEVVVTVFCSEKTVNTIKNFGETLGKSIIVAKDNPGFIINRLLGPFLLDAIRLLEKGIASREDIDTSMVLGCNHPMGPLRLADYIGLDKLYYISKFMYQEYKDPRYSPPQILEHLVQTGNLGKKTGKGFYIYPIPEAQKYSEKQSLFRSNSKEVYIS